MLQEIKIFLVLRYTIKYIDISLFKRMINLLIIYFLGAE
jgi:hypothetical protein